MPIPITTDAEHLGCPRCYEQHGDYGNLHQTSILSRLRDGEDGPSTSVEHQRSGARVFREEAAVLPGRRDSLDVHFECESCGDGLVLQIRQHKGSTLIEWVAS